MANSEVNHLMDLGILGVRALFDIVLQNQNQRNRIGQSEEWKISYTANERTREWRDFLDQSLRKVK